MDRWTRGCGSGGIGHSGHVNGYKDGVLVGNFVENGFWRDSPPAPTLYHLGPNGPYTAPPTTTQRMSFNPYGKTGDELVAASQRASGLPGLKGDTITRHGSFLEPPVHCLATTNQLHYPHPTANPPDRKVQGYLWQGYKQNDLHVPHAATSLSMTERKQRAWSAAAANDNDPFQTTWRTASQPSAMAAAEDPAGTRTRTLRPTGNIGLQGYTDVGRKPMGEHSDELDKTYRRIGLRTTYY